jgi:hypothetical protein
MTPHVIERTRVPRWVYGAVAAWLVVTATCLALVWRYKAKPGEAAVAPAHWPEATTIKRVSNLPTLVMFAHPECPCTKASLAELEGVMARVGGKVSATVVFVRPPGVDVGWEVTDLWRRAEAIPGISVQTDIDGVEAERFGVRTSGQVLLYDASGALSFFGGITDARGHVGDNVGRERLLSFIESHAADSPTAHVYGCELLGQARRQP